HAIVLARPANLPRGLRRLPPQTTTVGAFGCRSRRDDKQQAHPQQPQNNVAVPGLKPRSRLGRTANVRVPACAHMAPLVIVFNPPFFGRALSLLAANVAVL